MYNILLVFFCICIFIINIFVIKVCFCFENVNLYEFDIILDLWLVCGFRNVLIIRY